MYVQTCMTHFNIPLNQADTLREEYLPRGIEEFHAHRLIFILKIVFNLYDIYHVLNCNGTFALISIASLLDIATVSFQRLIDFYNDQ